MGRVCNCSGFSGQFFSICEFFFFFIDVAMTLCVAMCDKVHEVETMLGLHVS